MKKHFAFGSLIVALLLCVGVMAGIAFAVTPTHPVNIGNISQGTDVERMLPKKPVPIEDIDGVNNEDMAEAYEKIRNTAQRIGLDSDADVGLDDLRAIQESAELRVNDANPADPEIGIESNGLAQSYSSKQPTGSTNYLVIEGLQIPYVASFQTESAPSNTAGLWLGSDDVDDGTWGYFIGHNPGVFTPVLSLGDGSPVGVVDRSGDARTYYIAKVFDVDKGTTWKQIESDVTQFDESIILQTCINGGDQYRIFIAAA